jgi:hypothetical protein
MNILKPYITYDGKLYAAYIPYYLNNEIHEDCSYNTFRISEYFGLPTSRQFGEPSYTYCCGDNIYEIGLVHDELNSLYDKIKLIQIAIQNKGGLVYESDASIELIDYIKN